MNIKMFPWMKHCYLGLSVVLFTSIIFASMVNSEEPDESPEITTPDTDETLVVTLTNDTFQEFIDSNDHVLVKFYAPWCGHCKKLAPEFESAAKLLVESDVNAKLAKVDCTVETVLADKFQIKGFPTLKLFSKDSNPEDHNGTRSKDGIVAWLKTMTGPAVMKVAKEDLPKHKTPTDGANFIYTGKSSKPLYTVFEGVAKKSRKRASFVSAEDEADETIHVYRGDDEPIKFEGTSDTELDKFVENESFALFGPINANNFLGYAERPHELAWFCGTTEDFTKFKTPIAGAAKKLRESYSFVWLDSAQFSGHAQEALGATKFPSLVLQTKSKGRYVLDDVTKFESTEETHKFIIDVEAGKIDRNLKSEAVPENNTDDVKIVVGKNFESMVFHADKDVLLEVYAPWCGHCKQLEKPYGQLASSLKNVDNVIIAKMDGTLNEAPVSDFEWSGFPTLFFVKAGTKVPVKFDAERTYKGMLDYIKQNASKTIKDESIIQPDASASSGHEEL